MPEEPSQKLQTDTQDTRRSDRISVVIPVEVTGRDLSGAVFTDKARTVLVSRHGASVILNRKLAPEEEVILRCLPTGKEGDARVVGRIGGQEGSYVYGIAFLDANVNVWGIYFPPRAEGAEAAGRTLLECGGCRSRQVAYLNELEVEVFEANRSLSRPCDRCQQSTLWKQALYEPGPEREPPAPPPPEAEPAPPPPPPPRTENERRHVRISVKLQACIRHANFEDEIVSTENVSRSGLCFRSQKIYLEGSKIEVAIPYSEYAANIFVPGRIVWTAEQQGETYRRYGVMYLRSPTVPQK